MSDLPARAQPAPARYPSSELVGARLKMAGRMMGLEYPWEATRMPARAAGPERIADDDEPEVLDDEPRDLVEIFGCP